MAVSGLPEYKVGHAKHISLLALEMMDLSKTVTVDGEPVVRPHSLFYINNMCLSTKHRKTEEIALIDLDL